MPLTPRSMNHADESRQSEENDMSIHRMLRDCAKHVKKAQDPKNEIRTQAILLGQFTVALIACGEHADGVAILQKAVSSMLAKDSIDKRFIKSAKKLANGADAIDDVRFHCHVLTGKVEEAAEGDLMETISMGVLRTERELRIVVEALQAWISITLKDDWDTMADVICAMEEAQAALAKLDGLQKHAMSVRDAASQATLSSDG
jgi:hypothetical protein